MLKLIMRMFRNTWLVQMALIIVLASAVTVLMIYSGYISREGSNFSSKIEGRITTWDLYLAKTPGLEGLPPKAEMYNVGLLAAWREAVVKSNMGEIPCAFFSTGPELRSLASPGTVLVPEKLAVKFGITSGDEVTLSDGPRDIPLIAEVYHGLAFGLGFNFGDRMLVFTGLPERSSSFLYDYASGGIERAKLNVKQLHPNSVIEDESTELGLGSILIKNNYAGVTQAKMSLIMFLTVSFLTAKVLSFLDGRRTLAILKATGLRNNEVAAVITVEALLAPLVGVSSGVLVGRGILNVLAQRGTGLAYTPAIALSAAAWTLPAVLIGIIVPSRFAQIATVVELLFQRSIPLVHQRVAAVSRRFPAIEAYVTQGIHFLKLETVDGEFEGIIFRKLGDTVKQGEVIAHGTSWWGLKVTQYVAPLDGTIVYYQQETGFIGIGPEDMLGWVPDRSNPKLRLATVSRNP